MAGYPIMLRRNMFWSTYNRSKAMKTEYTIPGPDEVLAIQYRARQMQAETVAAGFRAIGRGLRALSGASPPSGRIPPAPERRPTRVAANLRPFLRRRRALLRSAWSSRSPDLRPAHPRAARPGLIAAPRDSARRPRPKAPLARPGP
jgi:hypothetical protein